MTYPVNMDVKPEVKAFFDEATNTISYVVKDPDSNSCAVVDSVMDIDYAAGRITYDHADEMIAYIKDNGLKLEWIIETHVHADHLSAAPYIQEKLGGKIGIGARSRTVQDTFGKIFNEGTEFQRDGSQFDALFVDGDTYKIGEHGRVRHVHARPHAGLHGPCDRQRRVSLATPCSCRTAVQPGQTSPAAMQRRSTDSIQKVLALPDDMRLFMCHDYGPNGRDIQWETTVGEEKAHNIHVGQGKTKEEFVKFRTERDATLAMPRLILPSLQVNMRAGDVPKDKDGRPMLKLPVNGSLIETQTL
jgi:hypothetical protein